MRRTVVMLCLVTGIALGILAKRVTGQVAKSIRLECVKAERIDAEHFRAVVNLVNGTKSDIYVQSVVDRASSPYPLYLERRVASDEWQIVAPCVDVPPSGTIAVMGGKSLTVDQIQSLDLPSNCRIRRIDPSGEFRWRIEYFTNRTDLRKFEKTGGHSGAALSIASQPFSIKTGDSLERKQTD